MADTQRNVFANVRRDLHGRVPLTLKAGLDLRQSIKDLRSDTPMFTYVASNASAAQIFDVVRSRRAMPFGFPAMGRVSNDALYDLYRSNPASFSINEAGRYTSAVQASKHAEETVTSVPTCARMRNYSKAGSSWWAVCGRSRRMQRDKGN